jgi:hypothetical protein
MMRPSVRSRDRRRNPRGRPALGPRQYERRFDSLLAELKYDATPVAEVKPTAGAAVLRRSVNTKLSGA